MAAAARVIRILIADGQAMFREGLRSLLEQEPDFSVVGEAATGRELTEQVRQHAADILLLRLPLPQLCGMEVLGNLSGFPPDLHAILFADEISKNQVIDALRHGARGVILKHTTPALLFKCIRAVAAGEFPVGRKSVSDLIDCLRAAPGSYRNQGNSNGFNLTRRERDITLSIVDGCTNKEIAQKLAISEQTVKHHLTSIFDKVGVTNRRQLALTAIRESFAARP